MRRLPTILVLCLMPLFSHAAPSQQSLDGAWRFCLDTLRQGVTAGWFREGFDRSAWGTAPVPAFWETYPGMEKYDGWGWFTRTFRVGAHTPPLTLYFAGADDEATVWVNGVEVGSHIGFSDPFALDISKAVREGDNTVVVLIKDYEGGGGLYKSVTLVETSHVDDLLRSPFSRKPARPSADWVHDAVIYSVYLRSFSPEGTFAGLERRVPELKSLGVNVLWLMPIHPVGELRRKGTLGSPYAVRDYYGINPEFGTMADFKKLLATVHRQGMKLIIDLVANHTSWDSKLITEHPEWFTKDSTGTIIAPNPDWTDVADLDYSKPGLRRYMQDMMVWWVKEVGIDGFRCDVAEMVPITFWNEARRRLDAVKPVMMLAEGSDPEEHLKAFDLTYSWNLYDQLLPLLSGKRPASAMDELLAAEAFRFPRGSLRMRFTTNHDKNAWDAPAVTKFGAEALRVATVMIHTMPGVPLVYTGEEVANDKRLDLFEKVSVDWSRPRSMGMLMDTLIHLRRRNPALSRGAFSRLTTDATADVWAFVRGAASTTAVVVLNLHDRACDVHVTIPPDLRKIVPKLRDVVHGLAPSLNAGGMLTLHLPPYGYAVYSTK